MYGMFPFKKAALFFENISLIRQYAPHITEEKQNRQDKYSNPYTNPIAANTLISPNPIGIFFFNSVHIAIIDPYKKNTEKNTTGCVSCDKISIRTKQ